MWPTHYLPLQARVDGVPPPRYYLTTPPYPLETLESLQSGYSIQSIGFTPAITDEEELVSNFLPVSGLLESILVEYEGDPEELASTFLPIAGLLDTILIRITQAPEGLDPSFLPISGELRDPLVRYENWPLGADTEDLTASFTPLSGVLS